MNKQRTIYNPRWWVYLLVAIPLISPLILFLMVVDGVGRVARFVEDHTEKVERWFTYGPTGSVLSKVFAWVNEKPPKDNNSANNQQKDVGQG